MESALFAPSLPGASERQGRRTLAWACAAFAGGVLLHADRVPAWAVAGALALIAWRLGVARAGRWFPGIALRALLALALVSLVLARFHTLNGLAAGTTLLMLMAALKLLETRGARDEWVMVAAGLFLLLAACLDRQELWRVPLYGLQAWLCCAALAAIASPALDTGTALRLAGRALLPALPLAAALFLFFPRLPGAFWAIPRGEQALTGLSDSMSPGSIVRLVASYEPAFRVTFIGPPPPPEQLYWRGPVLHTFDGYTWRRLPGVSGVRQPLEYLGTSYHHRVTLEPSRLRSWFALDTPARSPDTGVLLTYDYQLLAGEPVSAPVTFEAVSYTHTRATRPLDAAGWRQDTALPAAANPRSLALAQALRRRAPSDDGFVQAVLEYLRTGGFEYSITPEHLSTNAVDDFLFRTREGFCGHYASAFVTLMRAAGIPARVVTGYLGGEWNSIGRYLLVRQSDAHAWAEVWLPGSGWTRVDPTAVVAPERLRRSILDLLPEGLSTRERLLRASPWLRRLMQRWDAANTWWGEHVVRFDFPAQLELLARLGVRSPDARSLGWGFMLALCVWLALIAWHVARSVRATSPDALARAYARLCRKLARIAPPRAAHQGPMSFADAVIARRPDLRDPVHALLARYAELRFGPQTPGTHARDIDDFRRAVARLHLPRAARHRPVVSPT
ncbi:MAG TPA: transglutaminaseTgpA domain-containing protein [Steroidobacteraceae bacterium]|nr:transglutaminaseTgpA domain-containing protein [Steroidobacteraceae bacterium]